MRMKAQQLAVNTFAVLAVTALMAMTLAHAGEHEGEPPDAWAVRNWEWLSIGGDENVQQCGWLKDKYGVSWQIIPAALVEMSSDSDPARSARVMEAILNMKKINLDERKRAYAG
jgi:hypothetical protein